MKLRTVFARLTIALTLVCQAGTLSATDSANFRMRALQAAKKVRSDADTLVQPLIEAFVAEAPIDDALHALSKANGDEVAAAVLAEAMQLDQEASRIIAAENLGELGFAARAAVPALIAALRDEDEYVRCNAASALGNIGPEAEAAVPALIAALREKNEFVRSRASEALGKINERSDDAVPALILALEDEDSHVRFMTVEALGEFGLEARAAVQPLRNAVLRDADRNVRFNATRPLAAVDPEGTIAISALVEALKDRDPVVRRFAAMALGEFGPRAKVAAPLLRAGLRDRDIGFRIAAAGALWHVDGNSKDSVPVLIQVLEQDPDIAHLWAANELAAIGTEAKEAVPALRKSMAESHWPDAPAHALGNIGPNATAAVADLIALLESKKSEVRAHAAAALWKINRDPRAIPALLKELRSPVDGSPYGAIVAIGQIGPSAKAGTPDLLKALSARELYVRQAAAQALEKVDPAAVPSSASPFLK